MLTEDGWAGVEATAAVYLRALSRAMGRPSNAMKSDRRTEATVLELSSLGMLHAAWDPGLTRLRLMHCLALQESTERPPTERGESRH